jgi:hypothetical protein
MLAHAANMKESYENINNFWKGSSMKNMTGTMLGLKCHCSRIWIAAWLHRVLLFSVWVGH